MPKSPDRLLTDDRRIFDRADCRYDRVVSATGGGFADGVMRVELRLASGRHASLSVEAVADGTLRLKVWSGRARFEETSPMIAVEELPPQQARYRETEDAFTFAAGKHRFRVEREPFAAYLFDTDGHVFWRVETQDQMVAPPLGLRASPQGEHPFLSWRIENDERLFGLGEKFNKVEKTGTRTTIWTADTCGLNTTDLAYKGVPVLFSTRGWGMMLHSTLRSFWEVGSVSYISGSLLTEDDKVDLFLFAAPSVKALIQKYTDLTGRPLMPPKWAFGVWLSRCQYRSRQETEHAVAGMRERRIPCDVVHIDPMWMKTHYYPVIGVDACDFDWNEEGFPNREEMFRRFAEDGVSVCLWINPYLPEGTRIYKEAAANGYLVKDGGGRPARNEMGQPVGMVDFTNPAAREWWKDHLKALLRDGAAVFKPDYGERVPADCVFHNGKSGADMHNLYLLLYNQAVYEATEEEAGRHLIWGRSGYIGSQRYPGTWAGDTQVKWSAMKCCLRGGLSAGLTGFSFWSHDIGGFTGPKPSAELYTRWAQWGLLSPLSRFHGTTPREPWEYGPEAERIVARYCRLRYSLVPYLLAAAEESCRTGLPMMRHMALEFPGEPNVHTLDDQYMLGGDLLVAPVLVEGDRSRTVYLPDGVWSELDRPTTTHAGPGFAELSAPLSRIPVLVREGAVIPRLAGRPRHLKGGPASRIDVDLYPGTRARAITYKDENVRVRLSGTSTDEEVGLSVKAVPMRVRARFLRVRAEDVRCQWAEAEWKVTRRGTEVRFDARQGAEVTLLRQ